MDISSNNNRNSAQRGQALLIIVLIMVIALTVGLSLASRNVINIKLTTEEENSTKALTAAEAGIEEALVGKNGVNQSFGTATVSDVTTTQISGNTFLVNSGNVVNKDDGTDIWLTPFTANIAQLYQNPWTGNITIFWGSTNDVCNTSPTGNTMAALEVIVISGSAANPQLTRYAYDPCTSGRAAANKFTPITPTPVTINGVQLAYATNSISVINGLIIRVIPLYANTVIGVRASGNLPSQGQLITSTGTAGSTQRRINYFQSNDTLPSEFFYSIFSTQ